MADVICLGDLTSDGGKVTGCSFTSFKAGGKPMPVVGDQVFCPIQGHMNCTVASGNALHRINGKAAACAGDTTSCGVVLQSTCSSFSIK